MAAAFCPITCASVCEHLTSWRGSRESVDTAADMSSGMMAELSAGIFGESVRSGQRTERMVCLIHLMPSAQNVDRWHSCRYQLLSLAPNLSFLVPNQTIKMRCMCVGGFFPIKYRCSDNDAQRSPKHSGRVSTISIFVLPRILGAVVSLTLKI